MATRFVNRPIKQAGEEPLTIHGIKSLTGKTMLLAFDEAIEYQQHIDRFSRDHAPTGERELELVQALADTQWRLNKVPVLEEGLYALARVKYAKSFPDEPTVVRDRLSESRALTAFKDEFSALHSHETQLRRNFERDLAELNRLKSARSQRHLRPGGPNRLNPSVDSSDFHVTLTSPDSGTGLDFAKGLNQLFHFRALAPGQPIFKPFV